MTVETTASRVQYYTNGTNGPWTVPFPFLQNDYLRVIHTDASGVDQPLILDVDFTVSGAGDAAGAVTTLAANPALVYPGGGKITILRSVDALQESDYVDGDAFPAERIEDDFDRLSMAVIDAQETLGRALTFPASDSSSGLLPPAASRANSILGFDAQGRPIATIPLSGSAADVLLQLANTSDPTKGPGMVANSPEVTYPIDTVGYELRRWISLDHFVNDRTGATDVATAINTAIAVAVVAGAVGIYASKGSTYRIQSRIDLSTARNLEFDWRGATLIDDVRTTRPDMGGRGDHAFKLYSSSGVTVCNLVYQTANTRAIKSVENPSVAFWIGGQTEGTALTRWATVRNVVASTPVVGMMFNAIMGEAAGVLVEHVEMTGRWSYGVNCEYGAAPVDPAVDNTMTNGEHSYNVIVNDVRGTDLLDCRGFLRTAACYSVKFQNCQGSNVRNFIYGYVGDRNISRFSQSAVFENCKTKGVSNDFLADINYDVQILSVNKDGSTTDPLPAWTNYRHMFRFVNCEFQSGGKLGNASVRFFGDKGKVVFDQCIFRDTYYGLRAEPSTNPDYTSIGVLSFRDCLFVNNHQDFSILNCEGVKFEDCRFEDQNTTAVLAWGMLSTAPGTTFSRCRWSGKANTSPTWIIDVASSPDLRLYDNNITLLSTAHYATRNTDSRMKGFGNVCNGQLVNRAATPPAQLSVYGIVGEISTMYRDMNGVAVTGGSTITYEKGSVYEVSTTESLGRIIGGQVGDTVRFRATAGGANVTFTHIAGGVPTTERLINTSGATDNPTGGAWTRIYQKFDGGWYQVG